MKNSYKLLIFDDHYSVVSDESQAQITRAAAMIDTLMREIASKASQVDESRVAVLAALQMANRVLSLESQVAQLESDIEQTGDHHQELIERVERDCIAILRR